MTHIATHPPDSDTGVGASYPVYRMFGYLTLVDPDAPNQKVEERDSFRVLFFNNTGHVFKKGEAIACHLSLFEVGEESPLFDPKKKKKYCALAYDLMKYEKHKEVEKEALGKLKFEDLSLAELDKKVEEYKRLTKDKEKLLVMDQAIRYRRSDSFENIREIYQKQTFPDIIQWMKDYVVNLDDTKKFIYGCGLPAGNREIPNIHSVIQERLDEMDPVFPSDSTSDKTNRSSKVSGQDSGNFITYFLRYLMRLLRSISKMTRTGIAINNR